MGQCLKMQLKGAASNYDAPGIGEIRATWDAKNSITNVALYIAGQGVTIKTNPIVGWNNAGSARENPLTIASGDLQRLAANAGTTITDAELIIQNKYALGMLGLSNCKNISSSIKEILEWCPNLYGFGVNLTEITGSLLDFINYDNMNDFQLGVCETIADGNIRNFLNSLAERRTTGSIKISVTNSNNPNGCWYDIPVGFEGTYFGRQATVYFDSTYPDGWYIKAYSGTYYNSHGEVITP